MFWLTLIISIILVEAITEIIVKSELFEPVRKYFFDKRDNKGFKFIHSLLDCGYCFSVWVGWFLAVVFFTRDQEFLLINKYVDWFFIGLVLHRFSNMWHYIIDCLRKWSDNGQGI